MILNILVSFFFLHFISCTEKKICITKDNPTGSLQCSSKIEGINSGSDLTSDINGCINDLDTDVTLYLIGSDIEFDFKLNIFNNKKLTIQFDSESTGVFDVSEINNIDININFAGITNIYPTVKLQGSALNDEKTSISINKIKLTAEFSEIQLKEFSIQDSTLSFTKFTINSLSINANAETTIVLKDNSAIYADQTYIFSGENPLLSITLASNRQLVIDNQAASSNSLPSLSIQTVQSVTFKGIDFSQTNSISFLDCPKIVTDISYLPISSFAFSGSSSSDVQLNVNKALTVKGSFSILSSRDLIIGLNSNTESRVSIQIDSITLETGEIQILSSWIDLTINKFKFKSNTPPLIPCIGYGGSSTLTANQIDLDGQTSLSFNSISIKLDFNEELTDNDLPKLVNSQWNIIKFKSFTNAQAVSSFDSITFTPENIYGFGQSESTSIISIKSTVASDYTVMLTASSISALPYLVCFVKPRGSCTKGGTTISSLSDLATVVPADKKSVKLIINKAFAEIDLSVLQTTGAEFTIEYEQNTYPITSISMGDGFPNKNIDHIILNGISIGNVRGGESYVKLNSREITIIQCKNSSETAITFNENSIVNIDQFSFDQLIFYISNSFPQTNLITPIESVTSFEISEDHYIFTGDSTNIHYSKEKLPKVAFQIQLASNNDYALTYKTAATTIDSVDLKFVSSPTQPCNPKITVTFKDIDSITSANNIGLDFGSFNSKNTVDFSTYKQSSYFKITGQNIEIIPNDMKPNGKICTCKTAPCTGLCEDGYQQISYSELQQSIQDYSGNSFRIIVVGDQDGSSPILPLSLLNNKDIIIIGADKNAKVQIDCSSEFKDENKAIEFSNIAITHYAGNNFIISNLILSKGTTVDTSFNSVPLTVGNLECDILNLQFSSVSIQKSLILSGDSSNVNSNTKVTFASNAKFNFTLPQSISISGPKLILNGLEFDLSNSIPEFALPSDSEEFAINANNGNLDSLGSNIKLSPSSQLKSVTLTGTWSNKNPTKFIVFEKFLADLYLNSEDVPIEIQYGGFKKIEIGQEKVGIAGTVYTFSDFGDYNITTKPSLADSSSSLYLSIKEFYVTSTKSCTVNFNFETSNINLNVETLTLTSKFAIICFNMLIDLDHHNQVNILNEFMQSRSQALKYTVSCTITEDLNNPKMNDFINTNHTLMTFNKENTIVFQNSIEFDEKAPPGFNADNFMLTDDNSKLTFYTVNSPLEGEINLYYGNCEGSCKGTQIKDENLASLDKIIPKSSSMVIIVFYESLPANYLLNFGILDFSIEFLTLRSNSELRTVPVIFGNSISTLYAESISMKNDANDQFSIKSAKLTKGATFSSNAKLDNLQSLTVDKESIFASNLVEFKNKLEILLELNQPTDLSLSYTETGMKITDSQSKEFSIDVSKLPNVNLNVKSKESPKINIEKDVKELKQVQSFVLDSSLIHIGSNWDSLRTETPLVQYSIISKGEAVSVVTDSFPFEAWDLMYNYAIQFSDVLSPFSFTDDYEINGKKLTFSTFSPSTSKYNDIEFKGIEMNGESTIKLTSNDDDDNSDKSLLIIDEIRVKKNSIAKIINAQIKDEISLEPGSSLSDNFNLSNEFSEIELEWDLNQVPLLSPSSTINVVPEKIEIVYVGRSIEGREQQFNDFLSNGVVLIKNANFCNDMISKIKFKSETAAEFNDGSSLSIKCQCTIHNEIELILIPTPEKPTNEPPQSSSSSSSSSSSQTTPVQSPTQYIPTWNPTPVYPISGPTVDDVSYSLNGDSVEFTKNGYREGVNDFSGNSNKNEILLVNANSPSLMASTTKEAPNNDFYLSPKAKNAQISISDSDYGNGEIGIHANSNNPTIILPRSSVPLKLFNNEDSQISINVNGQQGKKLSLSKLLVNNGAVKFNVQNGVSSVSFSEVDVYNNGNIQSLFGQNQIETNINFLDMKSGSKTILSNARFGKTVKSAPNSKLVINGKSIFDQNTEIQLTESSFIEFGDSVVEGVCKEIKLTETRLDTKSKNSEDEAEIQLVCGSRFNCSSWLPKYSGDRAYPSAKCINFKSNNELCLVASTKSTQGGGNNDKKKPTLSGGAIAGICVACVVVVAIIIGVTYYLLKRHHANQILQYKTMDNAVELNDNPSQI